MAEPFYGEIQMFAFPFAPVNWAFCAGQIMPIQQNTALFSLLGTMYGGTGTTTFGLPNYGGFAPCSQGQGPGLSDRVMGEVFGEESVTLISSNVPPHTHGMEGYLQGTAANRSGRPVAGAGFTGPLNGAAFLNANPPPPQPNTVFSPTMLSPGNPAQAHENRQPYLTVNFCIALNGVFPSFS